jgi:hypothetical protein
VKTCLHVEQLRPSLEEVVSNSPSSDATIAGLNIVFAELLPVNAGKEPLRRAAEAHRALAPGADQQVNATLAGLAFRHPLAPDAAETDNTDFGDCRSGCRQGRDRGPRRNTAS